MNARCESCGFDWEGEGSEGHYLRSTSLNFGVTLVCYLFPVLMFVWAGWISALTGEVLAFAGAILVPLLIFRSARSWALMNYYVFVSQELPANFPTKTGESEPKETSPHNTSLIR